MSLPNVNGVSVATDPATRSEAIVVYVTRKVPRAQLRQDELIPGELEGIPIRVEEIGDITAQNESLEGGDG
jgi:hypothetical protein